MNPKKILGFLLIVFAVIDFAGQFLNYDLTGVAWSPIVAGGVGFLLAGMNGEEDEEEETK